MRLNLDMNILRHMSDGVLVLDRHAKIVAFNQVAEPWAPRCRAMSAGFKRLIDEERQGRLALPLFFDLQTGGSKPAPPRADAWLCKNGRNEYAVFIAAPKSPVAVAPAAPAQTGHKHHSLALLGGDVREQLRRLRELLPPAGSLQRLSSAELDQQCRTVDLLMQQVTDLSQLQEYDEVFAGERLSLTELIENILQSMAPDANRATVELRTSTDNIGPIYGNGTWLGYALKLLIDRLVASAPPRASLELVARQMGDFVILTGRANGTRSGHLSTVSAGDGIGNADPGEGQAANLQLMLCKRIIELHAGQLRLTRVSTDSRSVQAAADIESFTLTLMTSMPAHERSHASCADCRHVRQEIAYASDMAQLISNRPITLIDRSLPP
ncbi:MAG: hypothetical protein K9J77_10365 [Rhodoferax sp.]|nr:hypothetical protein [Rhodoferax sp.]